ncbi:hypothetical protein [Harryflintia acetispora]|uniref:hypothetical protein n=1 Tax=Harryflintia acetispora TaxID=1849041 RepID=UPI001896B897|nr:hypothetical protein [Harryflintia acetispora]
MSSINKTELGFNQWALSDKPTMEDFNADNVLVDQLLADTLNKTAGGTVSGFTEFTKGLRVKGNEVATFESGNWIPTCDAVAFSTSWASYTKIGNFVFGNCLIKISSTLSASAMLDIHGLPFPILRAGSGCIMRTTALQGLDNVRIRVVGETVYFIKSEIFGVTGADCKVGYLEFCFFYMA